jgi:hypothetical protein
MLIITKFVHVHAHIHVPVYFHADVHVHGHVTEAEAWVQGRFHFVPAPTGFSSCIRSPTTTHP